MSNLKAIIYPVTEDLHAFFEFAGLNENIVIQDYCVPENWYTCGKKMSLDNGKEIEMISINKCLLKNSFDAIIVLNIGNNFDFENVIAPYLQKMQKCNKKLYFVKDLQGQEKEILKNYNICYEFFRANKTETFNFNSEMRLLKIRTPIIFVLGMFENTDKLSTLLYIHEYLKQSDYKVRTVLTKENILNFPDCYSFPEEMYEKKYGDTEKIIFFNRYIRKIEIQEKPDVIVIGIPGEIMPLNEIHNGNFGIMPFLIGNAVRCDCAVLNIFSNFCSKEFAQQLMEVCKNKYLIEVNSVVISKMVLDITSLNMDKLKIYHFSDSSIETDRCMFYERKNNEGVSLGESILKVLLEYGNYSKI